MDGIDPLEAGPDIDPLEAGPDAVEPAQEDGGAVSVKAPRARKASKAGGGQPAEDDADQAALAALASAKDTAAKQTKKKKRKRADPFMPKGSVAPIEWQDFTPLEEGCRAHLVRAASGVVVLSGAGLTLLCWDETRLPRQGKSMHECCGSLRSDAVSAPRPKFGGGGLTLFPLSLKRSWCPLIYDAKILRCAVCVCMPGKSSS